ncbi:unnamed protein product [Pleuronectes platessa]|uniref:Uncharacterized protein n=1 Tax=Pleuronectes platessa TaxID=8262 RepID=A0A9N7Z7Q2_PLEPL|nr:unnamed protein product [Pleuronectes platessa]
MVMKQLLSGGASGVDGNNLEQQQCCSAEALLLLRVHSCNLTGEGDRAIAEKRQEVTQSSVLHREELSDSRREELLLLLSVLERLEVRSQSVAPEVFRTFTCSFS